MVSQCLVGGPHRELGAGGWGSDLAGAGVANTHLPQGGTGTLPAWASWDSSRRSLASDSAHLGPQEGKDQDCRVPQSVSTPSAYISAAAQEGSPCLGFSGRGHISPTGPFWLPHVSLQGHRLEEPEMTG